MQGLLRITCLLVRILKVSIEHGYIFDIFERAACRQCTVFINVLDSVADLDPHNFARASLKMYPDPTCHCGLFGFFPL